MTTDLFTLYETDTLDLSRFLMESKRIRHIPIVDSEDNFRGLLTHRDLLRVSVSSLADVDPDTKRDLLKAIPVREVMKASITTVDPFLDLEEAAGMMLDHKFGCLPVVNEGKLVGILTEADFVKLTISLLKFAKENLSEE